MPGDREFDPTTRVEFETLVKQLIYAAHDNGIDVEDGIDVQNPSQEIPDWTVEIARLEMKSSK